MSLESADTLTPAIHLSKLINNLAPSNVDRVIVMAPGYMKNLTELLSETPKDVLKTYFQWKSIQAFASYIESDALTAYKRFYNELQGKVSSL